MSFRDSNLIFNAKGTAEDVSASTISTNVIDLTATPATQQLGYVYFNVVVQTAISGDSLNIALLTKATEPSTKSGTILYEIDVADGVGLIGVCLCSVQIPLKLLLRWVGVYYTDASSISVGAVNAWLGMEPVVEDLTTQIAPS